MTRDEPQGALAQNSREYLGESGEGAGWTTTKVAAQMLGVSRRTVQAYVRRGESEARQEGEGPTKTFYVSIDSLNALRKWRSRKGSETASFAAVSADADVAMKKEARRLREELEAERSKGFFRRLFGG